MKRIIILLIPVFLVFACNPVKEEAQKIENIVESDPLPSWAEGPNKKGIIEFVNKVTLEGGVDYVPPAERISTFDQDGTLWCEMPVVQLEFVVYQIKKMAADHPEWKNQLPYKAVLEGDKSYLINDLEHNHGRELMKLFVTTSTGMSLDTFDNTVKDFFNTEEHPKYHKKFTETIYQPMLELLHYLRKNEFKTYICSGGGNDFMRVVSNDTYGIVPENIIGSFAMNSYEEVDGKWQIVKGAKDLFINDKITKPVGIDLIVGRVPIFSAGNVRSGGDVSHLTYCSLNSLPNFQLLINHDDAVREFAYSEKDNESLDGAKQYGWNVVSMKNDWLKIFPFNE